MPALQFMIMNALGAAFWIGIWGLSIYYLDENMHAIAAFSRQLSPYTWATIIALIIIMLLHLAGVFPGQTRRH
jgi:membrane protein DedA with SNARE-associated domain